MTLYSYKNEEIRMNSSQIFWPVLAQVFLTLVMFILLGVRKARAIKAGGVNRQQAAMSP